MIKFFLNIKMIFLLLLISLLLGISSKSYASSVPVPQSLNDFNNYIESIMQYMETTNDNYKALVKLFNSSSWNVSCETLPWGQYENLIIEETRSSSVQWYIDFIFYNGNYNFYVNGNYIQPNGSLSAGCYRYDIINLSNTYGVKALEELTQTYSGPTFTHRISDNYHFAMFFTPYEILNPNNVTIWAYNFPILDYFTWEYNPSLTDINIEDFPTMKQTRGTTNEIADFGLTTHLDTATWTYYYYNEFRGYWEPSDNVFEFKRYTIENESIGHIFLDKKMLIPNTIVYIILNPKDIEEYDFLSIPIFIRDNNSIVNIDQTTGKPTLNVEETFSGDYLDYYNNMINNLNNETIGTITNPSGEVTGNINYSPIISKIDDLKETLTDDSEVDNILSNQFSGDNLYNNIGYSPIENPFTTIILNTMTNFTDALLESGDEQLSFNVLGNQINLNSKDFKLPQNEFTTFLTLVFNAFIVYSIIKYGFQLYQWINTGKLTNLMNEANNHKYYLF